MNERSRLRLATEDDAAAIIEIYGDVVRDTAISFEMVVPDLDEIRQRMRRNTAFAPWLVAEERGRCLGYAYGCAFRDRAAYGWTAETAIYVASSTHRRGVARALYTALFEGLRWMGFQNLIAGITLPNVASVSLHESLGFRRVGVFSRVGHKHGAWHDVGFWERWIGEDTASLPTVQLSPPRTPAELYADPAWTRTLAAAGDLITDPTA
ncbi:MAG: N-acetyltransferase [Planctomycetes bacterium]|nr:N-acetyltransferase [Planctomycetota bacterium]